MPIEQCHFCKASPPLVTNSRQLLCKQCNDYKGSGSLQDFDTHAWLAWRQGFYTNEQHEHILVAIKAERAKKQRKSVAKAQTTIAANRSGWQEYYLNLCMKATGKPPKEFPNPTSSNGIAIAICDIVNWSGGFMERTNSTGTPRKTSKGIIMVRSGTAGRSDLNGNLPNGLRLAIEVKNKYTGDKLKETIDGRPSPQAIYRDKVLASGGIHFVAIGIDEFIVFWIELLKQQEK